jgi:hypothetical protein
LAVGERLLQLCIFHVDCPRSEARRKVRNRRTFPFPLAPGTGQSAPHRPLPRTGWRASGGKRSAIHSEGGGFSITSSARPRIVCGVVRPSALAVSRLMTNSNLVGTWTGRSAAVWAAGADQSVAFVWPSGFSWNARSESLFRTLLGALRDSQKGAKSILSREGMPL